MPETTHVEMYQEYAQRVTNGDNRVYESIGSMLSTVFRVSITPVHASVEYWDGEWVSVADYPRITTHTDDPELIRDQLLEEAAFIVFGSTTR
jgi:hypothetical protein